MVGTTDRYLKLDCWQPRTPGSSLNVEPENEKTVVEAGLLRLLICRQRFGSIAQPCYLNINKPKTKDVRRVRYGSTLLIC